MPSSRKTVAIYNVESLAKKAGVTRRTIHYYVQRGLLPRPEGGGRGHYYTKAHLECIGLIQKWREQGVPLEKMKQFLSQEKPLASSVQETLNEPMPLTNWVRLTVNADVEVNFKQGYLSKENQEAIKSFILSRTAKQ